MHIGDDSADAGTCARQGRRHRLPMRPADGFWLILGAKHSYHRLMSSGSLHGVVCNVLPRELVVWAAVAGKLSRQTQCTRCQNARQFLLDGQ